MSDKIEDFIDSDLIFAMGIRFWSKLVISEDIVNFEKCSQVLETLISVIESKQTYNQSMPNSSEDEEIAEHILISPIQQNETEYSIDPSDEELTSIFLRPMTHPTLKH